MALKEILNQEAEENETLKKRLAEEARLAELQQSITDIDGKIESMQSLLGELKQAHEQAGASAAGTKKEGKELIQATEQINELFKDDRIRKLLENKGINSLDDLLEARDYSEHEEVKSVKGLRQSRAEKRQTVKELIGVRRQAKAKARETITAERPDALKKLTYSDVVADLEQIIQNLSQERQELFYQTPKGQEALKAEILEKVSYNKEKFGYYSELPTKHIIQSWHTVNKEDIEKHAAKYGEDEVKTAIKEYWKQLIDDKFAEEAKKDGRPQLQEAVNTIDNLPKRWDENRAILQELQKAKREAIDRLAELLDDNPETVLFLNMNKYGNWHYNNPQKLAEAFIDFKFRHNSYDLGLEMGPARPVETIIEKTIADQKKRLEEISRGNSRKAISRANSDLTLQALGPEQYQAETELINPERIAIILAEQAEFYRKFQAELTTEDNVLNNLVIHQKIQIKSNYDLGINKIEPLITFDGKTYKTLRDKPLAEIKARLELEEKELAEKAAELKEQVKAKIEVDWDSTKLVMFQEQEKNHQNIQEAIEIRRKKKIAEELSPDLASAASELKEQMNELVFFDRKDVLKFNSIPEQDISGLSKKIEEANAGINRVNDYIKAIDERATYEKNGLFGGKKRRREKEKELLKKQKQEQGVELKKLRNDQKIKFEKDQKLNGVRAFIYKVKQSKLELKIPSGSFTLQQLIDGLDNSMNFQLTPEQSEIYGQYQALKKKIEQTKEWYNKKWWPDLRRG